ncbi:hypothetical protein BASA60_011335 [Batrachochytrium salamandrivorans]|nr:hypothetical protein BASA60_011335 [Batrachochytrium salamandrivorans]
MSNTLIVFALEVGDVVHITTKPTVLCSESRLPLNPTSSLSYIMPKIRRGTKPPPEGWELIEPTLVELGQKMRQAENEPSEAKRKVETSWPIMRLHHQRTRYIYDIYYRRKAISRDLYNYCIKEGHADAALIAKWRKPGYEKLCCLRCMQPKDTNFGTTCICRVPKQQLDDSKIIECVHCG